MIPFPDKESRILNQTMYWGCNALWSEEDTIGGDISILGGFPVGSLLDYRALIQNVSSGNTPLLFVFAAQHQSLTFTADV